MKKSRGFVGMGLVLAIVLGVAVVGGGAYYLSAKNSSISVPVMVDENNIQSSINLDDNIPVSPFTETVNSEESSTEKDVTNQPAYLKAAYVKNGKNYIDVDYIQMFETADERIKAMVEDGECPNTNDCYDFPNGYKRNSNPLIRTFEVDSSATINVYGEYNQYLNNGDLNNSNSLITFTQLKEFLSKQGDYEQYILLDVKNDKAVKIVEPYQE